MTANFEDETNQSAFSFVHLVVVKEVVNFDEWVFAFWQILVYTDADAKGQIRQLQCGNAP